MKKENNVTKNKKVSTKNNPIEKKGLDFLSGLLKDYDFEDDGMDNRNLKELKQLY